MMKLIALSLAALSATGLASSDQDTVIAYDSGNHLTWWCSDKDSFGTGVLFTPSEYPCEVIGARAEINYDDGREIYLRVWDDDGTGGLPGTILYDEQRLDIPPKRTPGFRDYDLADPVRIVSGDFYIVFWQKNVWDMQFSSDETMDCPDRQWWWFPDEGWVTPYGMHASDHLIRALVRYGTGVHEELGREPVMGRESTIISRGRLFLPDRGHDPDSPEGIGSCPPRLHDPAGRLVMDLHAGNNDIRHLSPGIYFVRSATKTRRVLVID